MTDPIRAPWTPEQVAALHRSAEETVTRVIDLYEQWVKAGAPPLGTPMSRWWDRRLVELRGAIHGGAEESSRTTPDNPVASGDLAEQLRTAIESEMYEYRERTMWWPETGGITEEIARLATRGALEALGLTEPVPPAPRDPCPHCEASSDRIPRAELGQHIADVHPEVKEQHP